MQHALGDERLAAICQIIRNETLDPARREAEQILLEAQNEAERIKETAKQESEKLLQATRKKAEEEKNSLDAALKQASKQALDVLRQQIEKALLSPQLTALLEREFTDEEKTAHILDLIIENLRQEGVDSDLSVWLGDKLSKETVVKHLAKSSLEAISEQGIQIGPESYGLMLKIIDKHISLEITPRSVQDMVGTFLRAEFRKILFS